MATAQCRLCFCEDDITKMVAPCNCSGSIKYIHPGCLRQCIHYSNTTECGVCKTHYNLQNEHKKSTLSNYLYDILSDGTLLLYSIILSTIAYDQWKILLITNAILAFVPITILLNRYYKEENLEQKQRLKQYLQLYCSLNISNIFHAYMFLLIMTILNIGVHSVLTVLLGESEFILKVMQLINLTIHTFNALYHGPYHYLRNVEFNDEFLFID